MLAKEIFAGPILRRAYIDMVAVWIATTVKLDLSCSVRVAGEAEWIGHGTDLARLRVCENLWVHMAIATPAKGELFPTGKILEYALAVPDASGDDDHVPFAKIVAEDALTYPGYTFPTFYLQAKGARLTALYVSCRKIHDDKLGPDDAMAYGDSTELNNVKSVATRPAVLCLTGDQIYADDVHNETFDALVKLAATLEGKATETLPGGLTLPGKGQRKDFVHKKAKFSSGASDNHVVTFAEYAALYGLSWSRRNWPAGPFSAEVADCVSVLPKVRRLMANTPTYMIFDDHDVTDDWNISLNWSADVKASPLGTRILTNALYAFWLFQAWGNHPDRDKKILANMEIANAERLTNPTLLWAELTQRALTNGWEFATPTVPFIYFLDTRTQRGHFDGLKGTEGKAPAWLKSLNAWKLTLDEVNRLLKRQSAGPAYPLVLVAPAPIWGYPTIEWLQQAIGAVAGATTGDLEGWGANRNHLVTFLLQCGQTDVVVLSGDVHYSFTSTARFTTFDSAWFRSVQQKFPGFAYPKVGTGTTPTYEALYSSRFVQLNSSAAKNVPVNWAVGKGLVATSVLPGGYGHVIDENHISVVGTYKALELLVQAGAPALPLVTKDLKVVPLAVHKPICALHQRVNNTGNNTPYLGDHNIGYLSITGRKVENGFLVGGKLQSPQTWDFATDSSWTPP